MSKQTIDLQNYVEGRLQDWGRWCKKTEIPGLYYSHLSNIGRIHEFGGAFIDSITTGKGEDNPAAEEMEKLLLELSQQYPKEAKAIIQYYSTSHDKEYIARKIDGNGKGITVRAFNHRIKCGKLWLEGKMSHKIQKYY